MTQETIESPITAELKQFKEEIITAVGQAIAASEARMTRKIEESEARMTRKIETAIAESEARTKTYVDMRVEEIKVYMDDRFKKLGSRWGVFTEDLWRKTIRSVVEQSFDGKVQERHIKGEQFDIVISNGHHTLIKMTARAKVNIVSKMLRKRQVYTEAVQAPYRVILASPSISLSRAEALRQAGIEIIEVDPDA